MQLRGTFASLALLVAPVLSAPTQLLSVESYDGETSGRYIVQLKSGANRVANVSSIVSSIASFASGAEITHEWELINGFAGNFNEDALSALRANPDVESISEDGVVSIFDTQTDAPWGLARLSQDGPTGGTASATSFAYTYDASAGEGVDIYVVDTGILTTHTDFVGRASWGGTFGGYANADGHGHGTHVSGTAAGSRWGVAKAANLIAIKVLSDGGSGFVSDIVSGLDFVASSAAASGRPSIATLSLGGGASTPLDNAVTSLVNRGIHVTVAAGNSNTDAANTSPARARAVITVGASTIDDARASFSNFGSIVDVFAPGLNVISSWSTSTTATNSISGTSMATPHVAGLVAYLIGVNGNASPASITETLKGFAISGALTGIPSSTANLLIRNDQ